MISAHEAPVSRSLYPAAIGPAYQLGAIVSTSAGIALGLVVLVVVWFALLWFAICYVFARASGWNRLRQLYETDWCEGPTSILSGHVGRSRVRGALIAGATPAGLYLNVTAPFRLFAGPVLIPWHDITVSPPSRGTASFVTLDFPHARTSLRVREDVARRLLEIRATGLKPFMHNTN
jgi:hypothetical protein